MSNIPVNSDGSVKVKELKEKTLS